MMPPHNKAAYPQSASPRHPRRPLHPPSPNQIVIRNAFIALNPLEQLKQSLGNFLHGWVPYPFVMGSDVAGEVVEVGRDAADRFTRGDRVVGHALGMERKHTKSAMGGFQRYTVLMARMASRVPETMDLERVVVLPLGLSTAACALFQKDQLGLRYPRVRGEDGDQTCEMGGGDGEGEGDKQKEVLLVWGGSSSVGCNAIQLAVAAGYDVIETCSPRNFGLVESLGARTAFDYHSETVITDIVKAFQGRRMAGAMSIGDGAAESCVEILGRCRGEKGAGSTDTLFLSAVSYPAPSDKDAGIPKRVCCFLSFVVRMWLKCRISGVRYKFVWGATLEDNEVGRLIYEDFLPRALEKGVLVPAPEPRVIGTGLEAIQEGLDVLREGLSARKLVVALEGDDDEGQSNL